MLAYTVTPLGTYRTPYYACTHTSLTLANSHIHTHTDRNNNYYITDTHYTHYQALAIYYYTSSETKEGRI